MATLVPERGTYHLDMVVLGRAGMDLYPEPVGTKTRDAVSFRADLGGSAGNIAVALARLGVRTGLIAPVSADPAGD
ncbi:MAG: PfkB family carbohydrate kinase, partial [Alphaproteobacteria bacterium]